MGLLIIEIGGTTPCTEYNPIDVASQLTINSATLEVNLINGVNPQFGDVFDIMNWGSITGSLGTIDTSAATFPCRVVWDTSQLYLTGELMVDVQHIADGDLALTDKHSILPPVERPLGRDGFRATVDAVNYAVFSRGSFGLLPGPANG